jgi:ABC-type glycerol-3-phosphate transport system substrate-binding protein
MSPRFTRREMLKAAATLLFVAPLVEACTPKQAAPAVQPTTAPAKAAPTTAPATQAPAAAAQKFTLTMATYADPRYDWQRYWAKQWADQHPNVELKVEDVVYGEMAKKQLAMVATGTLWDATYSGIKFFPYSVAKGCFMPLNDLVAAKDPGMDDMLPSARADCSLDGKLYAMPYMYHPGNLVVIYCNLTLLGEKGIATPTDDWTTDQFTEIATKTTNKDKRIWGTTYYPGNNYYDFCGLGRTFGGQILSDDGKKFQLTIDACTKAARWAYDLRATAKCAPNRDESTGLAFAAGQIALSPGGTYSYKPNLTAVADKFKFESVLHPKGPGGTRGYQGFTEMYSLASTCKHPQEAFDLIAQQASKEVGVYAVLKNDFNPNARKSVWGDPEIQKVYPLFARALALITASNGAFPMPYNVRFQELNDNWANTSADLFYGDVKFEDGMSKLQDACQKIMDLPRP